ncbi:MAG: hypothetical protein M3R52_08575 [Acidobacteriota bacterium]|nr:hypothetical protein [Acidobacteriota bacterium]
MNQHYEDDHSGGANALSDEAVRRCLLNSASQDEQARFEELLLVNDHLEKRVRLVELELADDYSFGRLSERELQLFETNFLVTEERTRKVRASQALRKVLALRASKTPSGLFEKKGGLRQTIQSLLRIERPLAATALAFIVLAVFAGWFVVLVRRPRIQMPALVRKQGPPAPEREYAHPPGSQSPSVPGKPHNSQETTPSPVVTTLTLQPRTPLDTSQTLSFPGLPAENDIVRLELSLKANMPGDFRAELLSAKSEQVIDAAELKAVTGDNSKAVAWNLPARLLKVGDYQVKLTPVAASQREGSLVYFFRVK